MLQKNFFFLNFKYGNETSSLQQNSKYCAPSQKICILHNLCYTKDTKRAERQLDSNVDR